ncbi:MAG: glycosyltransferase family 39 protein [Acidobacteria bacterium]|nr:glycosyltransferase family 39 protein [Acidobacteriota bacterium]
MLTVAPRLYHFTAPPVDGQSFRQGWTAAIIRNYVERDHNFLHPQIDILGEKRWAYIELPFYEYLLALPMMIVGYGEGLIRLFNIACGLATVLLLFQLLREEGLSAEAAAAGAGCYAATPIAIFFDRALMMDAFVITLGAVYLLCLRRWIESGEIRTLAMAALALAIAVPQKLPIAWTAAACGVSLVLLRKGWKGIFSRVFLLSHGVVAALMLGWTAFVWFSGYGLLSESFTSARRWYFGQQALLDWERMRYFLLRMANGFSVVWAGLALAGLWHEFHARRAFVALLGGCGISAFLVFPNLNIVHTHYQLPVLFGVAPLAGVGLDMLLRAVPRRARSATLAVCLAGATAWGFEVARWSHFPLNWSHVEAARELETIPQNGPQLFYIEGGYYPTLHYLARRRGLVIPDGTYPHSAAFRDYKELLVFAPGDQPPPAAIVHGLGPFRRTGHYHYWQVYRRPE